MTKLKSKIFILITAISMGACTINNKSSDEKKPNAQEEITSIELKEIYITSIRSVISKKEKGLMIKYQLTKEKEKKTANKFIKNEDICKYKTGEASLIVIKRENKINYKINPNGKCNIGIIGYKKSGYAYQ